MKSLFLTIGLFYVATIFSQNNATDLNLGFEKDIIGEFNGWHGIAPCGMEYDTIEKAEGKRSLKLTRGGFRPDMEFCLFQKILLPAIFNDIKVNISTRNEYFHTAWLIATGYNNTGKLLVSEKVSIVGCNGWETFEAHINHDSIAFLSIEIRTKEPFFVDHKDRMMRLPGVRLWIDDVQITCNGKNIYKIKNKSVDSALTDVKLLNAIIPLDTSLLLPKNVLDSLGKKKVVGFGETTHGSLTIDKFAFCNIRQLIEKYNCRLVLFEGSVDFLALCNLFIQGYTIDSTAITCRPPYTKMDTAYQKLKIVSSEFEAFMVWLRDYNASHSEKVNIMGLDIHTEFVSDNQMPIITNQFLNTLNIRSKTIDSLIKVINTCSSKEAATFAMQNEPELINTMGRFNAMVLLQILKSRTNEIYKHPFYDWSSDWPYAHRDYMMWQIAKEILDYIGFNNLTIAICAHQGHLNKISYAFCNDVVPLGNYFYKEYGNTNYYHLGILVGNGQSGKQTTWNDKNQIQELQAPIPGSVEYLAIKTGKQAFFKDGFITTNWPLMIRRTGSGNVESQFIPEYFPGDMDGFVFIRDSKSYFGK